MVELNDSKLLKIWLAYPLFCCTCILIYVPIIVFFWQGTNDIVDGSVEDHLGWVLVEFCNTLVFKELLYVDQS